MGLPSLKPPNPDDALVIVAALDEVVAPLAVLLLVVEAALPSAVTKN